MHLQPSEALRSDSLFEPYTLIYSLWTLESLTGMCLPFGVHPHSTSKQPLSISRVQTAAPSSAPDPTPRLLMGGSGGSGEVMHIVLDMGSLTN